MSALSGPCLVALSMYLFTPGSMRCQCHHYVNFLNISIPPFSTSEHTLGNVWMHQVVLHIFATHRTFGWVSHLWSYSQHQSTTHHCPVFLSVPFSINEITWSVLLYIWFLSHGTIFPMFIIVITCQNFLSPNNVLLCEFVTCAYPYTSWWVHIAFHAYIHVGTHLTCFKYTCIHCILYSHR